MRRLLVMLLLLLGAMAQPTRASAYPGLGGWSAGIKYVDNFAIGMGAGGRALDTFDPYDEPAYVSNSGWTGGSYHVVGMDGWDGPTGFYYNDVRATMRPGETKEWMLYIWAADGSAVSDLSLEWDQPADADPSVCGRLEYLQSPEGISGGPALGTVWTSPPDFTLPFYFASDGLTGYGFRFTLTMVPEPSSLLALVCGLGGVWVLIRRRRG